MPFALEVTATDQSTLMAGTAALVDDQREIQLRLDEDANPVSPGDQLVYTVFYANQTSGTLTQTLTLTIPPSADFVSASGDMTPDDQGTVRWPSIAVPARKGGSRQVVVDVPAVNNPAGSQLRAEAQSIILSSGSETAGRRARATAQTPVGVTDLELHVSAPQFADQDDALSVEVEVTNNGSTTVDNVSTRIVLPQFVGGFYTNTLADPGACPQLSNYCYPGDALTFDDVSVAPLGTKTFTIPVSVDAAAPLGALLNFRAELEDANGELPLPSASATVRVCTGSGC
jgi:archaellum component FlaF (FlaF/FlaG flagellin family)